jgi:hypothetical protein
LVTLSLAFLHLKVDQFGHIWVREDSMTTSAANLAEAEHQHQAHKVVEAHVSGVSALDPYKKQVGLHGTDVSEGVRHNAAPLDVSTGHYLGGILAQGVELAQMISQLRQDLISAMQAGEDKELLFELGPVELELTVAVSKEGGPNAKVRFWVIEVGADGKVASQSTQRIKLTLDPRR